MRVGIVGTGFMGSTHAAAWAQTPATVSGFVGKSAATTAVLAEQYAAPIYATLDELLDQCDVIDICTPTYLHHEMVLAAAAAGKDIVCEKPLARSLSQGEAMLSACREAGVTLLVAHVVRFFPEYALAQRQIAAGQIGQPAVVRLKRGAFQPKKEEDNWFLDDEKSGGMMLDLMIHDFDYARWIAGEVTQVYAQSLRRNHPESSGDHGLVILTHADGAISHIEGSWAYPPPLFRTQLEIAGSNGWLRYSSDEHGALSLHLHESPTQESAPDVPLPGSPLLEDPYTTQIKTFYAHLTSGAPTPVTAEDGLAALKISLAAIESARIGQPVSLTTGGSV